MVVVAAESGDCKSGSGIGVRSRSNRSGINVSIIDIGNAENTRQK